jgi:hypothetical protein
MTVPPHARLCPSARPSVTQVKPSYVQTGPNPFGSLAATFQLLWNDRGVIVAVAPSCCGTTFLLPSPGVRVDLADAVDDEPVALSWIADLNNGADMVGYWYEGIVEGFLLRRVGPDDDQQSRVAAPVRRHPARAPSAIERRLRDRMVAVLERGSAGRAASLSVER